MKIMMISIIISKTSTKKLQQKQTKKEQENINKNEKNT